VSDKLPVVTVLIPARIEQAEVKAVTAAQALEYPPELLEILVARGAQPSAQRNEGIRAAHGELIYFLDDDSVPERGNLRRAVADLRDPKVLMTGGPNVCPPEAPRIERVFALVLTAWLAFGPSRARYTPVGAVRPTSEKELILCNLVARRQPLLELGGFNEALYPNEENALMDELQRRGGVLLYNPQLVVQRRPRSSFRAFAKMLMTYGRGRAEQFRCHPTAGSLLNFVPPLFFLYLLTLPLAAVLGAVWLVPLFLYLLAVLGQGLVLAALGGLGMAAQATPLVVLTHVLYGLGFWRGLFTPLRGKAGESPTPVILQKVQ
jgi:succinoglycan biosynthesis protein ExoA